MVLGQNYLSIYWICGSNTLCLASSARQGEIFGGRNFRELAFDCKISTLRKFLAIWYWAVSAAVSAEASSSLSHQPWKSPSWPWVRLQMVFASPFERKMILVIIDSHSKWIEAYPSNSLTSIKVIELSCMLFSQFWIPEVLVTDNGPCFVSKEFKMFLSKNGI